MGRDPQRTLLHLLVFAAVGFFVAALLVGLSNQSKTDAENEVREIIGDYSGEDPDYTSTGILAVIGGVALIGALIQNGRARNESSSAPTPERRSSSLTDELERLRGLRKAGDLSDDEYQAAKRRVLDE